jgi:hypothetical protein
MARARSIRALQPRLIRRLGHLVACVALAGYLDTTGWLSAADYNDGTHPSDKGQVKIAGLLEPTLSSYLAQGR